MLIECHIKFLCVLKRPFTQRRKEEKKTGLGSEKKKVRVREKKRMVQQKTRTIRQIFHTRHTILFFYITKDCEGLHMRSTFELCFSCCAS